MKKTACTLIMVIIFFGGTLAQNVGIGTGSPSRAKLEVQGLAGNTAAIFGGGTGETGISLVANVPGVYFNSYYNSGIKSLSVGPVGAISLNNSSQFQFDLNLGLVQGANEPAQAIATRLLLDANGQMAVNMPAISNRAYFEQQGSIVNTAALFGGDGQGVSLQKNWPAIGLNHFYNGQHRSIGGGYAAQIGVDQNTGAIYFAQFSNSAPLANGLLLNPIAPINFRYGKIGVNTNDPQAPIEIKDLLPYADQNAPISGLRLTDSNNDFWNIYPGYSLYFYHNGVKLSGIAGNSGGYLQYSDRTLKKFIAPIANEGIQKVNKLIPSSYLFINENENTAKRHLGFIAQEVEEVVPEVVETTPDGKKMMNYSGLIPILTKAIQEQQKIIEKQQQQIDWLMKKVQ